MNVSILGCSAWRVERCLLHSSRISNVECLMIKSGLRYIVPWLDRVDRFNRWMGQLAGWSAAALVVIIGLDVLARYWFNTTFVWVLELETYCFTALFLLGGAYAFQHDRHVRVDVFYARATIRRKAWIDLLGGLLFLLPWCVVVLQVAYRYAAYSWAIQESSPQQGGLPMLYILKALILLGFVLMTLQAVVAVLRSLRVLYGLEDTPQSH